MFLTTTQKVKIEVLVEVGEGVIKARINPKEKVKLSYLAK